MLQNDVCCQTMKTYAFVCPGDTVSLVAYADHADVYEWYKNGEYYTSTVQNSIEVAALGNYSVMAYSINGCKSDLSDAFILARDTIRAERDTATMHSTSFVKIPVINNDKQGCYDFDLSTLKVVQRPWSGVATVLGNGIVEYIPDKGSQGIDQFVYTVTDKRSNVSNPAIVTIWVGNECGVVYPNPAYDKIKVNTRNNDVKFVRLCDMSGRILHVEPMQVGEKEVSILYYPEGVYVLQLMNGSGLALCNFKIEKTQRY